MLLRLPHRPPLLHRLPAQPLAASQGRVPSTHRRAVGRAAPRGGDRGSALSLSLLKGVVSELGVCAQPYKRPAEPGPRHASQSAVVSAHPAPCTPRLLHAFGALPWSLPFAAARMLPSASCSPSPLPHLLCPPSHHAPPLPTQCRIISACCCVCCRYRAGRCVLLHSHEGGIDARIGLLKSGGGREGMQ